MTKSRFSEGAHEHAAQFVREAVLAGRWKAGEAIDVTALAVELGISPSPVREALARLRGEGILSSRFRDGYSLPLLQPHELISEYRFMGAIASALVTQAVEPIDVPKLSQSTYAGRLEALLLSLARAADLPNAVITLRRLVLRLHPYIMAEPLVLASAERNLRNLEMKFADGDPTKLRAQLERHFAECVSATPAIARHVFEHSTRPERAHD